MNKMLLAALIIGLSGCNLSPPPPPESSSGLSKATVKVPVGADGLSAEQRNIKERLLRDNEPGAIKHLYVISTYTGQVLIYSTVKGKVTSGNKRLTPSTVNGGYNQNTGWYGGNAITIGGQTFYTNEVLSDDGAYGSSGEYLFWFSADGRYHQQYASNCIIHISDQPIVVKGVVLNMEMNKAEEAAMPVDAADTTISVKKPVMKK